MTSVPSTRTTQPIKANSFDELLACDDQHFVSSAYLTILGRMPDPEGMNYLLSRLRRGISKTQLLMQLRISQEGDVYSVKLPGLEQAVRKYRLERTPFIGWFFQKLHGSETNHPLERRLRAIENKLSLLNDENARRLDSIEAKYLSSGLQPQSTWTSQFDLSDQMRKLTPRAQNIFFQLKTAIAEHGNRNA
ncbi:DUF4214 domain-containing protein [Variovorax sp. PCZ-1]|uniref:DUF4214 domain-containing protein n=1 Tax=Variovorax sp. PCZ-1 TaxID=2835533 RepID=UPI001BCF8F85|nr:DUF4214 domain-containing protein [Variovorax sp. PCZ-1]MBS7807674.1 DUF4214 domain-containing protein [Variovorax sp. PCZ-1]